MKICTETSGSSFSTTLYHLPWIAHEPTLFKVYIINTWKTWWHDLFHLSKKLDEGPSVQPVAWAFFNTYWQPTLHYIGTLYYIITVASHSLSAYFNLQEFDMQQMCLLCVMHACEPRIIFPTPSLIIVNTHLILSAMHWTKMLGLHLMAKWNMGMCCADCSHMQWSE